MCDVCGCSPGKLMKCQGCRVVTYCGKECQIKAWSDGGHKHTCTRLYIDKQPKDAECYICLEMKQPILRMGCRCSRDGGNQYVHEDCAIRAVLSMCERHPSLELDAFGKCPVCKGKMGGMLGSKLIEEYAAQVKKRGEFVDVVGAGINKVSECLDRGNTRQAIRAMEEAQSYCETMGGKNHPQSIVLGYLSSVMCFDMDDVDKCQHHNEEADRRLKEHEESERSSLDAQGKSEIEKMRLFVDHQFLMIAAKRCDPQIIMLADRLIRLYMPTTQQLDAEYKVAVLINALTVFALTGNQRKTVERLAKSLPHIRAKYGPKHSLTLRSQRLYEQSKTLDSARLAEKLALRSIHL